MRKTVVGLILFAAIMAVLGGVQISRSFAQEQVSSTDSTNTSDPNEALLAKRRAQLQAQLNELEQLITQQQVLLQNKQGERVSLERDVGILDTKIKKAQLAIKARELEIRKLADDIAAKQSTINELSDKLDRERDSLAELLRKTDEIDNTSLAEIVLSDDSFSQFFQELDDVEAVKEALQGSFDAIGVIKKNTESAKQALENKHSSALELKTLQALEQQKIKEQEQNKKQILTVTKGQESQYKKVLAQSQKTAAEIRAELFQLQGSKAIPFGLALQYANAASAKTGVRPAFILGVLKQETELGANLGRGSWTVDMHPTRDQPVFLAIVAMLGLDANSVPVSKAQGGGYGGAMGPGQFIPSTWACYGGFVNVHTGTCSNNGSMALADFRAGPWKYDASADRLRTLSGKGSPSNPWDNQDAFLATAVYMMDLGATGGPDTERRAALKYYAGGNWQNPSYAFYGDSVMEHAAYYQDEIDQLKQLGQ